MRLTRAEQIARAANAKPQTPVTGDLLALAEKLVGGPLLPTQREFIFSPERRVWYTGPVGSAKTTALVASVIMPALLYPGSRWFVARKTYWTLEQTTMRAFFNALDRLGPGAIIDRHTGPPYRIWLAPAFKGAAPSEILFYSLDHAEKIRSMEFTGVAVDEANEVEEDIIVELDGRLRHRLPSQDGTSKRGPFFLRLASNPPTRSHWLHRKFCREEDCDPVPWGKKLRPLPRENALNLPEGYYETIAQGMSPQQRIRLIDGECGPDVSGQAVFPEFNAQLHVGDLKLMPGSIFIRGWDFGRRRPAVVWSQLTPAGHLDRLACMLGDNTSLQAFLQRVQNRTGVQFSDAPTWVDFVDPHGTQARDVTEKTSISVMREAGLRPLWKDVNIGAGIELMSKGLNTLIRGRPRSMFDRVNCNLLIEGYSGGYVYPNLRKNTGLKDLPHKDGYYEHLMDADRYIEVCLGHGLLYSGTEHAAKLRRNLSRGAKQAADPNGWLNH